MRCCAHFQELAWDFVKTSCLIFVHFDEHIINAIWRNVFKANTCCKLNHSTDEVPSIISYNIPTRVFFWLKISSHGGLHFSHHKCRISPNIQAVSLYHFYFAVPNRLAWFIYSYLSRLLFTEQDALQAISCEVSLSPKTTDFVDGKVAMITKLENVFSNVNPLGSFLILYL